MSDIKGAQDANKKAAAGLAFAKQQAAAPKKFASPPPAHAVTVASWPKWPLVAGGVAFIVGVTTLGISLGGTGKSNASVPGTPEQQANQGNYPFACNAPGGVQSFARQAPAGSNQFGPNYDVTNIKIQEVINRLQYKAPCDPSFMAALEQYRVAKGKFDPKATEDLARKMRDDQTYWKTVHQNFNKLLVGYDLRNNPDVKYASLGMIIDPNAPADVLPTFTQFGDHPTLGWTLVLKFDNDGDGVVDEELGLRVICDLQPALPEFELVPTPVNTVPTTVRPSTTAPRPTTTRLWTPPPTTIVPPPTTIVPPPTTIVPPPVVCPDGSPLPCLPPPVPCEETGECKNDIHVDLPAAPPATETREAAPPRVPESPNTGQAQGSANNEDRHSPGGVSAIPDQQQPVHDAEPDVNMGATPEPQAPAPSEAPTSNVDPDAAG